MSFQPVLKFGRAYYDEVTGLCSEGRMTVFSMSSLVISIVVSGGRAYPELSVTGYRLNIN